MTATEDWVDLTGIRVIRAMTSEPRRDNHLANCKLLKKCTLWEGSIMEFAFMSGGVTRRMLKTQLELYNRVRQADSLTKAEQELFEAILETLIHDP